MTTDLNDLVRRAFDDIIEAAGDLGPCPTSDDFLLVRQTMPPVPRRSLARIGTAGRSESTAHRWVAIAAGLLVVVGVGASAWVARRPDAPPTASGSIDLGSVDHFASGSVTEIDDPPLFVINDPSAGIAVFDARSTHLGCRLVPNTADEADSARVPDPDVGFVDPCHGSLFDRVGNKLAGPAPRSMDRFEVTIANQHVFVDVSQPIRGDSSTTPVYSGTDLDTTLPAVGRGWADPMDFSLSPDTNARLYNAWQTAIADCMHARGFNDHQPVSYPTNADFKDLVNPLDRRFATVMGYHELPAEPNDLNNYTGEISLASGECANAAYPEIWGRISEYINVNDQLRAGLSAAIAGFAGTEVGRSATSRWAACMAERGHEYPSRSDAIGAYADRPTISADEIITRLDDLDCDVAVSYTQAQHDWEQVQVDAWRQDQRETIDSALDLKQLVDQHLVEVEADQRESQD